MAKRGAGNYLTDQNWDQEDDAPEEVCSARIKRGRNAVFYAFLLSCQLNFKMVCKYCKSFYEGLDCIITLVVHLNY